MFRIAGATALGMALCSVPVAAAANVTREPGPGKASSRDKTWDSLAGFQVIPNGLVLLERERDFQRACREKHVDLL